MSIAPGFYWGLFIIKKNMCLNICLITKLYITFTKQLKQTQNDKLFKPTRRVH